MDLRIDESPTAVIASYGAETTPEEWEMVAQRVYRRMDQGRRFAIIMNATGMKRVPDAAQRQRLGEITATLMKRNTDKTIVAFAIVSSSAIVRGAATAISWLSPPVNWVRENFATLSDAVKWVDAKVRSEIFGDYELLNRIAMGGMAEVHRARKRGHGRFSKNVVIKRVLPHYSDDEGFATMLMDEAVIVSKLNHPNVVSVVDFGVIEKVSYIAMEHVEGVDLRRLVRAGLDAEDPLGENRTLQIGLGMCRGLGHAHERKEHGLLLNIVHRDVSPHNVLVSLAGDVKIMDFGIAKAMSRLTRTETGVLKGKIAYMSPEQARGEQVDARSDIYAVGVVLWELLAGQRAYAYDSEMELLRLVQNGEITPIEEAVPDISPALASAVSRLLAFSVGDRYQRMRDVEEDLRQALHELGGAGQAPLDAYIQRILPAAVVEAIRESLPLPTHPSAARVTKSLSPDLFEDKHVSEG